MDEVGVLPPQVVVPAVVAVEDIVLVQAVDLQPQVGIFLLIVLHQFHAVIGHGMAEQQLFGFRFEADCAVADQQRGVHGDAGEAVPGHGQAPACADGKGTALVHKVPNGVQIGLRNLTFVVCQGAVKVGDQQKI